MLAWYRDRRRRRLLASPFPEAWEGYLVANVNHYGLLAVADRVRLRDAARILVAEKNWEGCRGLRVTEEVQVTIAAQAALLLLGSVPGYFDRVLSILVYPSAFVIPSDNEDTGRGQPAAGSAVYRGPVILSWDSVLAEGRNPSGARNIVVHEFAHHLDFLDGSTNGTPALGTADEFRRWGSVMSDVFERLQQDLADGRSTFLRAYAGWNEAEFFAVASEQFFTRPVGLRQSHPRLYTALAEYYGVDPVQWFGSAIDPAAR